MSFREAIEFITSSASDVGRSVDAIFWALTAICGFMVLLLAVLILYFCIRYRRGSQADRTLSGISQTPIEIAWVAIPLLIFLGLFVWAGVVFFQMSSPPNDALEIHVVGKQWMWKIQHPDGRREINELHLPVGRAVVLLMISQDVIHSFYVPAFRTKQDVLPGRYSRSWFVPTKTGVYHLFCAEYCGTEHSRMVGMVHVLEPAAYAGWLAQEAEPKSVVAAGKRLFLSRGCAGCHLPGGPIRSPLLEGIFRKPVALANGTTIIADERYLRDSILLPNEHVVAGYDPVMPTFQGQLAEEEVLQLIAYLKSLTTERQQSP
jgi:cytochrome c oxidase subunit II